MSSYSSTYRKEDNSQEINNLQGLEGIGVGSSSLESSHLGNSGTITQTGAVSGSNNTVNVSQTDHGAVLAAFDFGKEAQLAANSFGVDALNIVDQQAKRSTETSLEAIGTVSELATTLKTDGASRNRQMMIMALVGVAGIAAVVLMVKK